MVTVLHPLDETWPTSPRSCSASATPHDERGQNWYPGSAARITVRARSAAANGCESGSRTRASASRRWRSRAFFKSSSACIRAGYEGTPAWVWRSCARPWRKWAARAAWSRWPERQSLDRARSRRRRTPPRPRRQTPRLPGVVATITPPSGTPSSAAPKHRVVLQRQLPPSRQLVRGAAPDRFVQAHHRIDGEQRHPLAHVQVVEAARGAARALAKRVSCATPASCFARSNDVAQRSPADRAPPAGSRDSRPVPDAVRAPRVARQGRRQLAARVGNCGVSSGVRKIPALGNAGHAAHRRCEMGIDRIACASSGDIHHAKAGLSCATITASPRHGEILVLPFLKEVEMVSMQSCASASNWAWP